MAAASGNQEGAEAESYCCLYKLLWAALSSLTLYVHVLELVSDYHTLCISSFSLRRSWRMLLG